MTVRSEEVKSALEEILRSPQFSETLSRVLSRRTETGPNVSATQDTPTVPSTITARIHEMFPSIARPRSIPQNANSNRNSRTPSRRMQITHNKTPYEREVLLLKNKNQESTLKRQNKFESFKNGYAKTGVKFFPNWNSDEIKNHLKDTFNEKLCDTDFDIFIPVSGFLNRIDDEKEDLTGDKLKRISQNKMIYLKPHVNLPCIEEESIFEDNDCNEDFASQDGSILVPSEDTKFLDELDNFGFVEDFPSALRNLNMKVKDGLTLFNVNRENVFNTAKIALQRKTFDPFNKVSVNFVDIDETSEGAIDSGGPSAEMFRLCLQYFQSSCLLEGNENSKHLSLCMEQLYQNNYFYCGQIIGMSIIHGYGGPNFLSELLFDYLSYGIESMKPKINDLSDGRLKYIMEQIQASDDVNVIQNTILEEDLISISGWQIIQDLGQKETLIKDVLMFHLGYRLLPALEQFKKGLESCEVLEIIKRFPAATKKLLCFTSQKLTFVQIKELFIAKLNLPGSNLRATENHILSNFYNFLADCEANDCDVSLEDLLIFTTGCSTVPPLGFKSTPSIEFLHGTDKIFPEASTCGLVLKLPVKQLDYLDFKNSMTFGIKNGQVFGFE